jgi:hypothetical protein
MGEAGISLITIPRPFSNYSAGRNSHFRHLRLKITLSFFRFIFATANKTFNTGLPCFCPVKALAHDRQA